MAVVAHSDALHALVAPDAAPQRLHTGSTFTEGPAWHPVDRYLLFSDIPAGVIRRWTLGGVGVWRSRSNKSNGLAFDRDGDLLACEHETARVTRTLPDGTVEVVADRWQGKQLNSPNDLVVARDGSIVFTDPSYGRDAVFGSERPRELDFQGVYRRPPRGELELLLDDFAMPNGLCLSPDETLLYVDDSERRQVRVFDWRGGSPQNGRLLLQQPEGNGVCDGIKCDARGNVWVTGPGGVWIVSPEGEHLGTIELPEPAANLTFGEDDLHTLFVTATTSLYRVRTLVAGRPLAPLQAR